MLDWRQKLLLTIGPGMLPGIRRETWLELLTENDVDTPFQLRRTLVSGLSFVNSAINRLEEKYIHAKFANLTIKAPVFIIGHWRSGTTHLHQIITRDRQFSFPNLYQVYFPDTFLHTEWLLSFVLGFVYKGKRFPDNLVRNFRSPGEDEIGVCISTGKSPYMGNVFPRNQVKYDKYLTFRSASQEEIAHWRGGMINFLKMLTWKYGKPLVLKSPTHTCRIKLLLDMFPDARFIHIHRNPYDVLQSTLHLDKVTLNGWGFQKSPADRIQWIIRRFKEMYNVFLDERHLISPDRFYEMRYEDLVTNPIGQLEALYNHLGITGFEHFQPILKTYLASLSSFKRSEYQELPPPLRKEVGRDWSRFFEEWKYLV